MTIVEVLVALAVLALAVLFLMPLFVGVMKTMASSNQLTSANTLVREKLEELSGYPRDDPRIAVPAGQSSATFGNDLPSGYNPSTGAVCPSPTVATCPTLGTGGWYVYPYTRTYTVQEFDLTSMTIPVTEPPIPPTPTPAPIPGSFIKLVTVTIRPTKGPFPGLRQTTQSIYLRFPNG